LVDSDDLQTAKGILQAWLRLKVSSRRTHISHQIMIEHEVENKQAITVPRQEHEAASNF